MSGKKKQRPVIIKQGLDGWVMTYGDMMSLLLTFFVLIVSFSSMQETKFKDAAMSLRKAFGVMVQPESVIDFNDPLVPKYETEDSTDIMAEIEAVERALLDARAQQDVQIDYTPDGVRFRISAPLLFGAGESTLSDASRPVLDIVTGFLDKLPGEVSVEGHSDATPIATRRFPSNWELSAARAGAVARYFQRQGLPPDRIAATGFGEFRPLDDNGTAAGRARNRRVEIFLRVQKNGPAVGSMPLSGALDARGASTPRPTPVTDRLRSLQSQP